MITKTKRLSRTGYRQVSDITDPDYSDKLSAKQAQEYLSLKPKWRLVYAEGLTATARKSVMRIIKTKKKS